MGHSVVIDPSQSHAPLLCQFGVAQPQIG